MIGWSGSEHKANIVLNFVKVVSVTIKERVQKGAQKEKATLKVWIYPQKPGKITKDGNVLTLALINHSPDG